MANPLFADDQDDQINCYDAAVSFLKSSPKFRDVLPSLEELNPADKLAEVTCKDRGNRLRVLPPGIKEGDRVANRLVDFDVTLTLRPLINGMPLGGTKEAVHVRGLSGYLYGVDDSAFDEIDELRYNKTHLI